MPDDTAFCSGDTIVIGGPPDTLSTYNWIPNQYIDCNTCSQVKIYPPANAVDTYKVEVNLAGNCLLKDSMAVYVQEPIRTLTQKIRALEHLTYLMIYQALT